MSNIYPDLFGNKKEVPQNHPKMKNKLKIIKKMKF